MTQAILIHPMALRKIVIGRSPAGLPRTYRLERNRSRSLRIVAALRRIAA
jgi:hypothetical protein